MVRTNKAIYDEAVTQASKHYSPEQIALNAMYTLRREMALEEEEKMHSVPGTLPQMCAKCVWNRAKCNAKPIFDAVNTVDIIACNEFMQ